MNATTLNDELLLVHEGGKDEPYIEVKKNGLIVFRGDSLMIDAKKVYQPVCWAINKLESEMVTVVIELYSMNPASMKYINIILRILSNQAPFHKTKVLWFSRSDKNDYVYFGKILEELYPRVDFLFNQ